MTSVAASEPLSNATDGTGQLVLLLNLQGFSLWHPEVSQHIKHTSEGAGESEPPSCKRRIAARVVTRRLLAPSGSSHSVEAARGRGGRSRRPHGAALPIVSSVVASQELK